MYTHRSTYLHALTVTSMAGMAIGPSDDVLAVVPMFHANAWGMPHAATMVGAKQVFLAGPLEPTSLVDVMDSERVTVANRRTPSSIATERTSGIRWCRAGG